MSVYVLSDLSRFFQSSKSGTRSFTIPKIFFLELFSFLLLSDYANTNKKSFEWLKWNNILHRKVLSHSNYNTKSGLFTYLMLLKCRGPICSLVKKSVLFLNSDFSEILIKMLNYFDRTVFLVNFLYISFN